MRNAAVKSVAVGFFDGVHLGHRAILSGADVCITFANHPLSLLAPECAPRLIMSLADRVETIRACGIDSIQVLTFDRELLAMSPDDFAARYLDYEEVRCGRDWRFGHDGAGNAALLERLGRKVVVSPDIEFSGDRISSSRIRACIERGEIAMANEMLGYRFFVRGKAFEGKGIGREIGYPTLNLKLQGLQLHLPNGVYQVEVDGLKAIANYGVAPTMGESAWSEPVLELHFLEKLPASASVYKVDILSFLRPERKFSSILDLKHQIAADIDSIR